MKNNFHFPSTVGLPTLLIKSVPHNYAIKKIVYLIRKPFTYTPQINARATLT